VEGMVSVDVAVHTNSINSAEDGVIQGEARSVFDMVQKVPAVF
jgi:hypothetical protein